MSDPCVVRALRSDDAAFAHLYRSHYRSIRDYCRRRLAADLVDDAVAEIFLAVWRRIDDVPPAEEALAWMYGVAYRVIGRQWRSASRRHRLEDRLRSVARPPACGPDDAVIESDEHRLVLEAAGRLGDTDAEVLRLLVWEGLAIADIAAVLGIEVNAVKQRLHRAKQHLAREYRRLESGRPRTPAPEGGTA